MFEVFFNLIKALLSNPWIVFLGLLTILLEIYYKRFRGYMGEFWVKRELNKLPNDKYFVLNDIMIENNNSTHQIDHLVLSKYGIFVIEMKNFYGYITGNEYEEKWVQRFGKNKYYFKNPIHQNYGHFKALGEVLSLGDNNFVPIVCISNQARLRVESRNIIVQLDDITKTILSFTDEIVNVDLNNIKEQLLELNIIDKKQRKKHVTVIKDNIKDKKEKINNNICPKCGGFLVERKGKYGMFVGCSNFPKCKFIKK